MKIKWHLRDTIALLILPLEFFLSYLYQLTPLYTNSTLTTFFPLLTKLLSLIIILKLFGDIFKNDWHQFRQKIITHILFCIAGAIFMFVILFAVRSLVTLPLAVDTIDQPLSNKEIGLAFIASIPPILAPFVEEIIFRYVLIFKFQNHRLLRMIMLLFSSVLFGMVHYFNFNRHIMLTIPYMIVALFLGIVYLRTKNIWYATWMHFLFNFTNSLLPVIFLFFLSYQ